MSLESTIRGVLTNKQAPKEQEKVEFKESKEEKVVQFISSLNEAKDPNEYDKEGDMMKSQLRQIDSAIDKLMGMVNDDDNLPEWVQSKMTKATDYIRSVRDYLESEKMNEEWVCGKCNCDPCTCENNLEEKTLTPAELKKREEIAKAIERENPDMPMPQKMAIATAQAKKTTEAYNEPQGQAKRMMSPLQKARMDKEKADRDRDGKLKPDVTKEAKIDEISMSKMQRYGKAAAKDIEQKRNKVKTALDQPASVKHAKAGLKAMQGLTKRSRGSDMYVNKMTGRSKVKPTMEEENLGEAMNASSIEKAMRKALKDRGNYKNGKVNWNFVDADTYMEVKPGRAQVKQFYRMFDQIANKLTKEMDLKEDISEAKKVSTMQIHKVLAPTKNSREGIAALKKAFRVNDMEAKKMLNQVMNEETIDEISRSMTPMRKKFGGAVDPKKFDMYKKHVKQHGVDEPTVRMIIDNPNDAESKRMMKNKHVAQAVSLRKAAMKEAAKPAQQRAIKQLELARKARAMGDHERAEYHTQLARQLQNEGTFISKFKEELKEKKRGMSETKGAPKGYHFTRSGQLKKGDAGQDGPGGKMLRSDPLDKQRKKIPPLPEQGINRPAPRPRPSFPGTKKPRPFGF